MEGRIKNGLVQVYTGDGKGKTTASFGAALRAVGAGWKVHIVQFVKAPLRYGEVTSARRLEPDLSVVSAGKGFVREGMGPSREEHARSAREALSLCEKASEADLLVMDEVNFALAEGLLDIQDVLALLDRRPETQTVILTGRNAPEALVDRADLVTEMREIKHPYHRGIKARKGIEF